MTFNLLLISLYIKDVQNKISIIATWADKYGNTIVYRKCGTLHCKSYQPIIKFTTSTQITNIDSIRDLECQAHVEHLYSAHYSVIFAKANRVCDTIRCTCRSEHCKLLWSAFVTYVLPIMKYWSPVRSSCHESDLVAHENVQQSFT